VLTNKVRLRRCDIVASAAPIAATSRAEDIEMMRWLAEASCIERIDRETMPTTPS